MKEEEEKICPKCGSKCNYIEFTYNTVYIFYLKCSYQT